MSKIYLGRGADGEALWMEARPLLWLIHCEGNSQSPFKFKAKEEALEFANLLIMQRIDEL